MLKRLVPRSLFGRSLLIIVLPVLLLQILLAVVFFDRHLDRVTARLARSVAGDLNFLATRFDAFQSQAARRELLYQGQRNMNMRLEYQADAVLDLSIRPTAITPLDELLYETLDQGLPRGYMIFEKPEQKAYELYVPVKGGALFAVVPFNRFTTSTTHILAMWQVGAATLFLTIAILFLRNQVKPIRQLAEAAEKFGRGLDVEDYRPAGASEVRLAGNAFRQMSERIQRQIRQRTEMLAGVSHDLKTPLTRMRLELEMLGEAPGIEDLKADISEMEEMIEAYLAFARGAQGEQSQEVDLADLLGEIAAGAERDGSEVTLQLAAPLAITCRPLALKRCVTNLVDNARHFGNSIRISARRDEASVTIDVDDDGPGIAPEQRREVFRPFVRLDTSRNPGTGGVGLGLAIARDTIRGQGGDVVLEDSDLGGLRARVRIPL